MLRAHDLIAVLLLVASPSVANAGGADPPGWADVAEIFAERCVMCHSEKGAGRGLRLDSYEAVILGGERGAVLVPGDSDASELIRRLRGQSTPRMPFLSRALPPEQIELIERWVDAGLPGPSPSTDTPNETAQGEFQ